MKKRILPIVMLFFAMSFAQAQKADRILNWLDLMPADTTKKIIVDSKAKSTNTSVRQRKADKMYNNLGYKAALDIYEDLYSKNKLDVATMQKIANSHRLNNETTKAEFWYARFINQNAQAEDILHYAQVLQTNGRCEDAIRWYNVFNENVKRKERVNIDFIEDCAEATVFKTTPNVKVTNASRLNSDDLDYSPIPYKNGVIFTSTRATNSYRKTTDNWTKENFSDLYFSERNSAGNFKAPKPLKGDINGKHHDGVASFNSNENIMFFSRNNTKGKNKKGVVDLKIYQATLSETGMWENAEELPFNSSEFATCHPSLSADGSTLYFASDRPGGFGGMDIYASKSENGSWSAPMNLGPTVNTSGNELFPFLHKNGQLYFASTGHRGMGGLDVFMIQKNNKQDETSWTNRENMGAPFNTEKDDFGFVMSEDGTYGFLTSSRIGGKGQDDIYEWAMETPMMSTNPGPTNTATPMVMAPTTPMTKQIIKVIDNSNNRRIDGAMMEMDNGMTYTSDINGEVTMNTTPSGNMKITIEKSGYQPLTQTISPSDWKNGNTAFRMKRNSCTNLNGTVMNKDCNKPMPGASVRLFNKCTGNEETMTADAEGNFDFCLDCACDYMVIGSKKSYTEDKQILKTIKGNCATAKPFDVTLNLSYEEAKPTTTVVNKPMTTTAAPATTRVTTRPVTTVSPIYVPMNNATTTSSYGTLSVGKTIALNNIYYDYNKATIRAEASSDLDELARIMMQYPSMEIQLGSHTDARGAASYNQTLSANRAASAKAHLIRKGIASKRITTKGFGESQLLNQCADGVNCSESEHQKNRRTEVTVTRINDKSVKIIRQE